MAIVASDIVFKLSTTSGSAGNTTAGVVGASLGKYVSTTTVADGSTNGLFPNITGAENAASQVDYACVFVHNTHGSLTLQAAKVYVSAEVSGGASVAIGVDPTAVSAVGSSSAQAVTIANDTTAPAGVTFSTPTTSGAALSLGDIGPGQVKAFWVRRTAANTAPLAADGATFAWLGDTL
ncbi:hypothetical protein [Micromonospora carbonacea]|uniref:Uncharacterized protein n=1 Tax=Micromonospora carbonacea TaxID=47853 RepID=A0A1C5AC02_9ACTN|nr:hypothetical protein [Micromonospora carbonacea]SCF42747.1 hypothetical protein GA0070563_112124 [Micromonospora carbonacea]